MVDDHVPSAYEPTLAEGVDPGLAPVIGVKADDEEQEWIAAMHAWIFLSEEERLEAIKEVTAAAKRLPVLYAALFRQNNLHPRFSLTEATVEQIQGFLASIEWSRKLWRRLDPVNPDSIEPG